MSSYAFRDTARTQRLNAKDATSEDKTKIYFCPNSKCSAKMVLCNLDGLSQAYFRATKSKGHIVGCDIANLSVTFDKKDYNEKSFNFNNVVLALFSTTIKGVESVASDIRHPTHQTCGKIRTIRQLYNLCKTLEDDELFNGYSVKDMFISKKTIHQDGFIIEGSKLLEAWCSSKLYNKNKKSIQLEIKINDDRKYKFLLYFRDVDLYYKIKNKLFINRCKNVVVVAGDWHKDSSDDKDAYKADITSKRQITYYR